MHARNRPLAQAVLSVAMAVSALVAQYPNSNTPLGINPFGYTDYGTEVAFVDMFMYFRGWEHHGAPDGITPLEQLDESGWPRYLNPGQQLTVGHGAGSEGHFPGGRYLFTWEGEGTFSPRMGCTFVSTDLTNKRIVINVDSTQLWWGIRLDSTNPDDHARNMHCWLPGFWYEATYTVKPEYANDPWHPEFIRTIERFSPLRMMAYMPIHGYDQETWEWDDYKPQNWWNQGHSDHAGYGHSAPGWSVKLANRVHGDLWLNVPHQATNDCVTKLAELMRDSLNPELNVYVEYSNECWNWAYPWSLQAGYCTQMAQTIGLPGNGPAEYYAYRSAEIWRIFDGVFGTQSNRVKKVLAWQTGTSFSWHFDILDNSTWNPDNQQPDICAIAPYVHNGGDNAIPIATVTVEQFLDRAITDLLPGVRQNIQQSAAAAAAHGCQIGAYEANQHFFSDIQQAQDFFISAKRHPKMKDLMDAYTAMIDEEMDGPLCMFGSHGLGTWGAREYYNQPREEAYTWDSWLSYIESEAGALTVAPPSLGLPGRLVYADNSGAAHVFSLLGRRIPCVPGSRQKMRFGADSRYSPGMYVMPQKELLILGHQ
jgi:hypothetical protein